VGRGRSDKVAHEFAWEIEVQSGAARQGKIDVCKLLIRDDKASYSIGNSQARTGEMILIAVGDRANLSDSEHLYSDNLVRGSSLSGNQVLRSSMDVL
jgi:hypothetical protein